MWTFGGIVTEADNVTSATITKHIINLTFANIRPLSFFSWTQPIQISICMKHQKCKIGRISVYTPFVQPDQTSWCSALGEQKILKIKFVISRYKICSGLSSPETSIHRAYVDC